MDSVGAVHFEYQDRKSSLITDFASRAARGTGATTVAATPAWSVNWIGAPTVWGQGYKGACVLVLCSLSELSESIR